MTKNVDIIDVMLAINKGDLRIVLQDGFLLLEDTKSGERVRLNETELVQCKDCCFTQESPFTLRVWCDMHHKTMKETDFCSYGKRREDNVE